MKDWQGRVIVEEAQLGVRLDRLNNFIDGAGFKDVSDFDRVALDKQAGIMAKYREILNIRMARFVE